MAIRINAEQIKDQVPMVDLLARLGHAPAYRTGKELFYTSMLREEKTPSLCVNEHMDVWYDHGGPNRSGIKGGNVIDFGLAYWHPATFPEVLEKISSIMAMPVQTSAQELGRQKRPRQQATRIANYRIETVKELNTHPVITRYLQSRGIWEAAQGRLSEVYYCITGGPKQGRQFFSAGWQNEAGGWELRNRIGDRDFKSCLGRKAISLIPGSPGNLSLFEGYMDYLSWLRDNPETTDTVIVLNSVNLLDAAVDKASSFATVNVYFDRDKAGEAALDRLIQALPQALDRSDIYKGYKDYNEMLMARPPHRLPWEEDHVYEKILSTYRR
ncbi:toprim domain-containing protein [Sphingobacterium spiritivorum]|uniref:toprim domain-containing protein n=1 Tax=Sphingobacterium spiritivorum TaxID=258 RepID=UPI003DA51586